MKKLKLDDILSTYNLSDTVDFPTRKANSLATLIDEIY
jgi:hypothetical protein